MHMFYISNSFKMHKFCENWTLKFRPLLLKVSFSRPFQLMKINCTESYVFFLARTYRARIQLSFTNTRCIQYTPYVNPCVSPYRVPNLTLGTKYKYTNEHKSGILNVLKHCNNSFRNRYKIMSSGTAEKVLFWGRCVVIALRAEKTCNSNMADSKMVPIFLLCKLRSYYVVQP